MDSEYITCIRKGIEEIHNGETHLDTSKVLHISQSVFERPINLHCLYHFMKRAVSNIRRSLGGFKIEVTPRHVNTVDDFANTDELIESVDMVSAFLIDFKIIRNTDDLFYKAMRLVRFAMTYLNHFFTVHADHPNLQSRIYFSNTEDDIHDDQVSNNGAVTVVTDNEKPSGYNNYFIVVTIDKQTIEDLDVIIGNPIRCLTYICPHCNKPHISPSSSIAKKME